MIPGRTHFFGGLNKVTVTVELKTVRVIERLTRLHTEHGLVSLGLVTGDVVAVIRNQRRQVQLPANLQ